MESKAPDQSTEVPLELRHTPSENIRSLVVASMRRRHAELLGVHRLRDELREPGARRRIEQSLEGKGIRLRYDSVESRPYPVGGEEPYCFALRSIGRSHSPADMSDIAEIIGHGSFVRDIAKERAVILVPKEALVELAEASPADEA